MVFFFRKAGIPKLMSFYSPSPLQPSRDQAGVGYVELTVLGDERGSLISLEQGLDIPFEIKRAYYIFDTKKDVSRGFHAHLKLEQLIVCVSGHCRMRLDTGHAIQDVILDSPRKALSIKGLVWREMHDFSADCVLMVFASEHYDEKDYIRDYGDFLDAVRKWNPVV